MKVSDIGKKYDIISSEEKHDTFISVLFNSFKLRKKKGNNIDANGFCILMI